MKKIICALSLFCGSLAFSGSTFALDTSLSYVIHNSSQRDIQLTINTKCMSDSNFYNYTLKPAETISEDLGRVSSGSCFFDSSEVDIGIDNGPDSSHNYHFSGKGYRWDAIEVRADEPQEIIKTISSNKNDQPYKEYVEFEITK